MVKSKYFSEPEFKRCDPPCSLQDMSQVLMDTLDSAREAAGIPFVLNCAYRSVAWDKARGRSGNSAHTRGLAVDIRCNTSANRFKIVSALLSVGFNRIGIGKSFVHADVDSSLAQDVMFDYYE